MSEKVRSLEIKIQQDNFWGDQNLAQTIIKKRNVYQNKLFSQIELEKEFKELQELIEITDDQDANFL